MHGAKINSLHEGVQQAVGELKVKVGNLERSSGGRGGFGGVGAQGGEVRAAGYLPMRSMVPWAMKDDVAQWRRWTAKALTYTAHVTPGMKTVSLERRSHDKSLKYRSFEFN